MSEPPRHFRVEEGPAGGMTVWIDVAGKPVNIFWDEVLPELDSLIAKWEQTEDNSPIVIRSAKAKGFAAGADLKRIAAMQTAEEVEAFLRQGQQVLDRLERLRRPTVAVISGHCLGGGLELALACQYRVAIDIPTPAMIGLPETSLGLIPGWGGTQRLPRLVGLSCGLELLLSGEKVTAADAFDIGLVDHVLPTSETLESDLRRWIRTLPRTATVSDSQPSAADADDIFEAERNRWLSGIEPQPARDAILKVVRAGWPNDFQAGLDAERREFLDLIFSDDCRRRLEAMFTRKNA